MIGHNIGTYRHCYIKLTIFKAFITMYTDFSHGHRRKAGRELQTALDTRITNGGTLSEKSAEAGHRAVSLHRDCVLV